jgi:hypothetical protein
MEDQVDDSPYYDNELDDPRTGRTRKAAPWSRPLAASTVKKIKRLGGGQGA